MKHKKRREWYAVRDKTIKRLGFDDYPSYLASPLWKSIRLRVLKRANWKFEVCDKGFATEVHHRSYCFAAMTGRQSSFLVATCRECHDKAEFAGEHRRKTSPREANRRMAKRAWRDGRTVFGICRDCRKNPVKVREGATLCGDCKKPDRIVDFSALTDANWRSSPNAS